MAAYILQKGEDGDSPPLIRRLAVWISWLLSSLAQICAEMSHPLPPVLLAVASVF